MAVQCGRLDALPQGSPFVCHDAGAVTYTLCPRDKLTDAPTGEDQSHPDLKTSAGARRGVCVGHEESVAVGGAALSAPHAGVPPCSPGHLRGADSTVDNNQATIAFNSKPRNRQINSLLWLPVAKRQLWQKVTLSLNSQPPGICVGLPDRPVGVLRHGWLGRHVKILRSQLAYFFSAGATVTRGYKSSPRRPFVHYRYSILLPNAQLLKSTNYLTPVDVSSSPSNATGWGGICTYCVDMLMPIKPTEAVFPTIRQSVSGKYLAHVILNRSDSIADNIVYYSMQGSDTFRSQCRLFLSYK